MFRCMTVLRRNDGDTEFVCHSSTDCIVQIGFQQNVAATMYIQHGGIAGWIDGLVDLAAGFAVTFSTNLDAFVTLELEDAAKSDQHV